MGTKPMIILFVIIISISAYLIAGSESVSKTIENYVEENYKQDPVNYEKYTFMNAVYMNWTAKYDRALEILDNYDKHFEKEENREKSQFERASAYDGKLEARKAKDEFKKYIDEFPNGKHIEKAKERYDDLKSYT